MVHNHGGAVRRRRPRRAGRAGHARVCQRGAHRRRVWDGDGARRLRDDARKVHLPRLWQDDGRPQHRGLQDHPLARAHRWGPPRRGLGAGAQVSLRVPAAAHDRHRRKDRRVHLLPGGARRRQRRRRPAAARRAGPRLSAIGPAHREAAVHPDPAGARAKLVQGRGGGGGQLCDDGGQRGRGRDRPHLFGLGAAQRGRHRRVRHALVRRLARGARRGGRPAGVLAAEDRRGCVLQHVARAARVGPHLGGALRVLRRGGAAPQPLDRNVRRRLSAPAGNQVSGARGVAQLSVPARVPQALPGPDGRR
mmetsp:Transcript_37419/g.117724  ORF Transcript_37419/g.117724 Transcript_37419/m.117724 type:complete len:306 (-) Transcript_37419:369-1286(-)